MICETLRPQLALRRVYPTLADIAASETRWEGEDKVDIRLKVPPLPRLHAACHRVTMRRLLLLLVALLAALDVCLAAADFYKILGGQSCSTVFAGSRWSWCRRADT